MLPKALSGLDRHGAFLNYETIAMRAAHDQPGDGLNGTEIGLSIIERRSSDADEDGLASINCYRGNRKLQPAGSDVPLHQVIQVRLKERHPSRLEGI